MGQWTPAAHLANVEKLARVIEVDPARSGGVHQLVLLQTGRGTTSAGLTRLGRYSVRGLDAQLVAAYRFLAYNYTPGDEIYLFGFARGALAVRRLAGVIARVGLLNRESSVRGLLPQVMARYHGSQGRRVEPFMRESEVEFKHDHCFPEATVHFLGVFETVGTLGVPGRRGRSRPALHDTTLNPSVRTARQALAIDEEGSAASCSE